MCSKQSNNQPCVFLHQENTRSGNLTTCEYSVEVLLELYNSARTQCHYQELQIYNLQTNLATVVAMHEASVCRENALYEIFVHHGMEDALTDVYGPADEAAAVADAIEVFSDGETVIPAEAAAVAPEVPSVGAEFAAVELSAGEPALVADVPSVGAEPVADAELSAGEPALVAEVPSDVGAESDVPSAVDTEPAVVQQLTSSQESICCFVTANTFRGTRHYQNGVMQSMLEIAASNGLLSHDHLSNPPSHPTCCVEQFDPVIQAICANPCMISPIIGTYVLPWTNGSTVYWWVIKEWAVAGTEEGGDYVHGVLQKRVYDMTGGIPFAITAMGEEKETPSGTKFLARIEFTSPPPDADPLLLAKWNVFCQITYPIFLLSHDETGCNRGRIYHGHGYGTQIDVFGNPVVVNSCENKGAFLILFLLMLPFIATQFGANILHNMQYFESDELSMLPSNIGCDEDTFRMLLATKLLVARKLASHKFEQLKKLPYVDKNAKPPAKNAAAKALSTHVKAGPTKTRSSASKQAAAAPRAPRVEHQPKTKTVQKPKSHKPFEQYESREKEFQNFCEKYFKDHVEPATVNYEHWRHGQLEMLTTAFGSEHSRNGY